MSTILDALRRLQREQEAAGAERELRHTITSEIPLPEDRRPSRAPLWLVSAGVLLLAVGGAGFWWMGRRAPAQPEKVARAPIAPAAARPAPAPRAAPVRPAEPAPAPPIPVPAQPAPSSPPADPPVPAPAAPITDPPLQNAAPAPPAPTTSSAPAAQPGSPPPTAQPPPPTAQPAQAPSARPPVRPARISPVRVAGPAPAEPPGPAQPARKTDEAPAADAVDEKVEEKAQAAPPPRKTAPARAPEPRPTTVAPPAPPPDLPQLSIIRLRWHPEARRRSASVQLEMREFADAREGDIVEGVQIEEILPDAIVVRVGDALHRIALQP